jgi:hypothetical protein
VAVKVKEAEEGVVVVYNKKTPAQKIRDYFKHPKWYALTKKQEERYARIR